MHTITPKLLLFGGLWRYTSGHAALGGAVLPWKPKGGHPLREHYSDVRIRHRATQIDDGER